MFGWVQVIHPPLHVQLSWSGWSSVLPRLSTEQAGQLHPNESAMQDVIRQRNLCWFKSEKVLHSLLFEGKLGHSPRRLWSHSCSFRSISVQEQSVVLLLCPGAPQERVWARTDERGSHWCSATILSHWKLFVRYLIYNSDCLQRCCKAEGEQTA